jgi:predicted pyridoxine 5'-phosphate oxidase superfamily flavin-nucleotide-binding protein
MVSWREFADAAPELARPGEKLLDRFQFVLIGTLTRDGSPRVNPVEAYILDGRLLVNMIPRSLKALDLLRDPRMYVHAPVTAKSGDPEFKLAGRAAVLEDATLRRKLDDLFWSMIEWRPLPDSHYFELFAERAAYVTYGDQKQIALRWSVEEGVRRSEKADI